MLRKITDALEALLKPGPYAPLMPEDIALRDRVVADAYASAKMRDRFGAEIPASYRLSPLTPEEIKTLESGAPFDVRKILNRQDTIDRMTYLAPLIEALPTKFMTSRFLSSGRAPVEALLYLWTCYARYTLPSHRPKVSTEMDAEFQTSRPVEAELLPQYCALISSLVAQIEHVGTTDAEIKSNFVERLRKAAREEPEKVYPLEATPDLVRGNDILAFYVGDAFTDAEIEHRTKLRAEALKARADAEARRAAALKAFEEAEKRAKEQKKKDEREKLENYISGAYAGTSGGMLHISRFSALESKDFFVSNMTDANIATMRSNVTAKVLQAIKEDAPFRVTVDEIQATRPPTTMGAQALMTLTWYYVCLNTDIMPSDRMGYAEETHLKYALLSCMIYDDQSYISHYETSTPSMYAGAELRGRLEVLMSMRLRSPQTYFQEVTSYARGFAKAPGAFGDLARRITGGAQATGGWATHQ